MTSNELSLRSAIAVGALATVWLAMLLLGTGGIDHEILREFYAGHRAALADSARLVTMLGDGRIATVLTALGALVLIVRKQPWPALILFAGTLLGRLLVEIQKYQFNRVRPAEDPHLVEVHTLSFPSGHSANAAMTYVALVLFLVPEPDKRWKWLLAAGVVALLVGLSRVMLGVHWPSDVVGGWTFGLFWALLLCTISVRLKPREVA
jgi:undecaprenyl-diphosphatase